MQNVCGAFKIIRVSKVSEYMTPVTGYFKQFNFTSVIMIRSQLFEDWMTVSLFKSPATYHLCIQEGGNHSSLYGCLNYNPTVLCVLYDFLLLLYFNMITRVGLKKEGYSFIIIYHILQVELLLQSTCATATVTVFVRNMIINHLNSF